MTQPSQTNSQSLLDRYLHAVRFWLPKAQQQDIVNELSEDLHAQIEEQESALKRPLNESELEAILKRCGSPIIVASRYRPQKYLIGPALFPIWQFVLKLVLVWVLLPILVVVIGPALVSASSRWQPAVWQTFSMLCTVLISTAAAITIVFAVLERLESRLRLLDRWNPHSLPPAPRTEKRPSRTQSVFEIITGVAGLLWLLALPHYPFLVLGPLAEFLKAAPLWPRFYLPMALLAILGVAYQCVGLFRPQWTWLPPAGRLLNTLLSLAILHFLIELSAPTQAGIWQPYVVVREGFENSAQCVRVAGLVNVSVLLSLVGTWIGLCIAPAVQAWRLTRQIRERISQAHLRAI